MPAEVARNQLETDQLETDLRETEQNETAVRLLDAAERIFATKGIEAASVRAITQAANANIAAVHYHFGSKQDLVQALIDRRVGEMTAARRPLLDAALAKDHVTARDVAEAWVRPIAALALRDGGARRTYLSFLVVMHAGSPELRTLAADVFRPQQERFAALLARALPDVDEPVRWLRFTTVADTTIRALADPERTALPWREHGGISEDELVEHVIDLATGILAGPPSTTTSPSTTSPSTTSPTTDPEPTAKNRSRRHPR